MAPFDLNHRRWNADIQNLIEFMAPPACRWHQRTMSTYLVTIVNEHFAQSGEQEASDHAAAWKKAIASAIAIASDQVSHGNPFFGAEVTVECGKERVGRYLISVGATPLKD